MPPIIDIEYHDGVSWVAKAEADGLGFYGGDTGDAFDDAAAVNVSEYQASTHFRTSEGLDGCASNGAHVTNLRRGATDALVSVNGAPETDVTSLAQTDCLRLRVHDDDAFSIVGATCFAFDGVAPESAPSGFVVKGLERGDASFTDIGGSANALDLGPSASATVHVRHIGLSVTPLTTGTQSGQLRVAITYI